MDDPEVGTLLTAEQVKSSQSVVTRNLSLKGNGANN